MAFWSNQNRCDRGPEKLANEEYDQQKYDRGNIDAAEVRKKAANGSQRRLGDAIEKISYRGDEPVTRIDYVEGIEP